ncbi:MAG: hypothetical protein HN348_13700 [Proteobacteria bacterium]|nr:hypothetical protein [Pseudomonadota bacterium]
MRAAQFALFLFYSACGETQMPPPSGLNTSSRGSANDCVSSEHETSNLDGVYSFDLDCALAYFASVGCDFDLDPDQNGRPISSSTLEDLFNDSAGCVSGSSCTGCDDDDSLSTISNCRQLAATAYFTENAWKDLAYQCPAGSARACSGGTWSGVTLDAQEECDVLEIVNWATRGQLTQVDLFSGPVSPTAGILPSAATNLAPAGAFHRNYETIDQLLDQPQVDGATIAKLKAFIEPWTSSGQMGDPEVSAEDRLLLFVNDPTVTIEEFDFIAYIGSSAANAIVDGRPHDSYEHLVSALGGMSHYVETTGSLYEYAQEWYIMLAETGAGCTIEGTTYNGEEMTCALRFFSEMTCESCGELFDSRICEDAINSAFTCMMGDTCTGCDDGDGRDNGVSCKEIAEFSYFGPSAAELLLDQVRTFPCDGTCTPDCDLKTCGDDGCGGSCGTCAVDETCDVTGSCSGSGCTIEGLFFDEFELDCATTFFETMDCASCSSTFDSRICEDAINDATICQVGSSCTGCEDGDTRADGVSCDEIAAYSYFASKAAAQLLDYVRADASGGAPEVVVEGVPLTAEQVTAILALVNGASLTQLDDEGGLDSRAANNIVDEAPHTAIDELALVPYVGKTVIELLRDYAVVWLPEDQAPISLTVLQLADEVAQQGTSSSYFDKQIVVARAIVTSDPFRTSRGNVSFYIADPTVGGEKQLKVYIANTASLDTSFASIYDDVEITGLFTQYNTTFELLLQDGAVDSINLNTSGLAYDKFATVQAAWPSTAANPEGVVRTVSSFDYTFMVPLPVFLDHPMWNGNPPGSPSASQGQDHNWIIAAQGALNAWSP